MSKNDTLEGVRLKLKRAWRELDCLKADVVSFLDGRPYAPTVHFNKRNGRLTVRVQPKSAPDPMWGVRVGEIIHNFRCPLDHVVWELAGRPSGPGTRSQFPIFMGKEAFNARAPQFLKGVVSEKAKVVIESEQPLDKVDGGTGEGESSPLWQLKELSDIDKHRTIHLTASLLSEFHFQFPPLAQDCRVVSVERRPAGPIAADTILWGGTFEGVSDWPFEKTRDVNVSLEVNVAFERDVPATGTWELVGTLISIGNRAERVLRRLAEDVFDSEL